MSRPRGGRQPPKCPRPPPELRRELPTVGTAGRVCPRSLVWGGVTGNGQRTCCGGHSGVHPPRVSAGPRPSWSDPLPQTRLPGPPPQGSFRLSRAAGSQSRLASLALGRGPRRPCESVHPTPPACSLHAASVPSAPETSFGGERPGCPLSSARTAGRSDHPPTCCGTSPTCGPPARGV